MGEKLVFIFAAGLLRSDGRKVSSVVCQCFGLRESQAGLEKGKCYDRGF